VGAAGAAGGGVAALPGAVPPLAGALQAAIAMAIATSAASERILSRSMVVCILGFLGCGIGSNTGNYVGPAPAGFPAAAQVSVSAAVRYHPQAL